MNDIKMITTMNDVNFHIHNNNGLDNHCWLSCTIGFKAAEFNLWGTSQNTRNKSNLEKFIPQIARTENRRPAGKP